MQKNKRFLVQIRFFSNRINFVFLALNGVMLLFLIGELLINLFSLKYTSVSLFVFPFVLLANIPIMIIERKMSVAYAGPMINYGISFLNFAFAALLVLETMQPRFDPFLAMGGLLILAPSLLVALGIYSAIYYFIVKSK